MQIKRNQLIAVLSEALDRVEKEVRGVADYHAKRVAWLCIQMGRNVGMTESEISNLTVAALLHDSALNEYRQDYENGHLRQGVSGSAHCVAGENNLKLIFKEEIPMSGYVLYHHEKADGTGPFGKYADEVPVGAQFIHIADDVDAKFAMGCADDAVYQRIEAYVAQEIGRSFSGTVADCFLQTVSVEALQELSDANMERFSFEELPSSIGNEEGIAEFFARIIDYKSPFTKVHSLGVAGKAERLAESLGYDEEHAGKMYLAGALHDIGKLFVHSKVLEKPGRLDAAEYQHIQSHAYETYRLLSKIEGFEEIRDWASYHHEKLNGLGYPFGLSAEEMSEEARILACIDIYQALTEDRPYKAGMSHGKAVGILKELAGKGELDDGIVAQIEKVFENGGNAVNDSATEVMALFQCPVCGYIYEGDALPYEYECPVCGQPGHKFGRVK